MWNLSLDPQIPEFPIPTTFREALITFMTMGSRYLVGVKGGGNNGTLVQMSVIASWSHEQPRPGNGNILLRVGE